jgi:isopenicillin-N epimerase
LRPGDTKGVTLERLTPEQLARHWALDPDVTFLNHGSFGATPWPVLHAQSEWRARMEREPVLFLDQQLDGLLAAARARLGEFLGADADDLAFVPNATAGVNTVVKSLEFEPGDEILTNDHEYNASLNAMAWAAARAGARLVVAHVPFPVASADDVAEAIIACASPRTRLAVISHITSPTAMVFPIERLVRELAERGIDTLVDGAHAPGMVPLDLAALGAAYYTGNAHKWLCAPKGSGFLHVRRDRQDRIHPLVTSHGANKLRDGRSAFRLEFDWTGTSDPTAYLSTPTAIDFVGSLLPGGWPQVMAANRALVLVGRRIVRDALGETEASASPQTPDDMVGSIAAIELPTDLAPIPLEMPADARTGATYPGDPMHDELLQRHWIEVPVYTWPHSPTPGVKRVRLLRISAQLYNQASDYERLAAVLSERTRSARP